MFKSLIGSCTGLLANILNYSQFLNVSSTMIIKSNFDQSTAENLIAFFFLRCLSTGCKLLAVLKSIACYRPRSNWGCHGGVVCIQRRGSRDWEVEDPSILCHDGAGCSLTALLRTVALYVVFSHPIRKRSWRLERSSPCWTYCENLSCHKLDLLTYVWTTISRISTLLIEIKSEKYGYEKEPQS